MHRFYNLKYLIICLIGTLLIFHITSCQSSQPNIDVVSYSDEWARVSEILDNIKPPSFPNKDFNIVDFGALADGTTDNKSSIVAAVDACSESGGGRVVIPAGVYLVNGPIHLKSNVNLNLSKDAVLKFGVNPEDYLPAVLVRWEGTRCYNYSPLIYAYQQKNIAITGEGTIDGQAEKFWYLWKLIQRADKDDLREMGKNLVPVEQRMFAAGHFLRPTMIETYECENILIEGITVKGSPFWTVHPVLCTNVTIRNLTVEPGKSNDDGSNPESCQYVLIENCSFNTQDDNIAIKAGRDQDAWIENGGRPSENIVVRNCRFKGETGGITIGSEMSGGVRNVFVENCFMDTIGIAFYVKSNTDRGGTVENIHYRNIKINNSNRDVIRIQLDYKGATAGKYPAMFRNFFFENITAHNANNGIRIFGLPGKSINDIYLKDFTFGKSQNAAEIYYVNNLSMENVELNMVSAIQEEYLAGNASEEQQDRLYWNDLPKVVQKTFLQVINSVVDSASEVPVAAREDIKRAYADNPTITIIEQRRIKDQDVYQLTKIFGSDNIVARIAHDGTLLE